MKCPKCGYSLPDDSLFCQYCGIKLDNLVIINGTTEKLPESPAIEEGKSISSSNTKASEEAQTETVAASPIYTASAKDGNTSPKKNKQRYCKLCGQAIDGTTKKCTGCGKQYLKVKSKVFYVIIAVLILFGGYVGINYFSAVSAMNDQEFIKAQQFFDNLLVSETLFPAKYEYVEAGVLMEEGKYVEALNAFNELKNIPVPASITDFLKTVIYAAGQGAYSAGNSTEAETNFEALNGYKRSDDYLLLIRYKRNFISSWLSAETDYSKLVELLDFEDAKVVIIKNDATAKLFLEGHWEDSASRNPYYFELQEDDSGWHCWNTLPHEESDGYFYLSDAIYSVGETESTAVKYYKFTIIDEDTISVYCYKDGSTYKLYRH